LVGKSERSCGPPRHGWEDNPKIGLKEMRREGVCWIERALVSNLIDIRVP
jgi:hypothetical protein